MYNERKNSQNNRNNARKIVPTPRRVEISHDPSVLQFNLSDITGKIKNDQKKKFGTSKKLGLVFSLEL